MFRKQQPEVLVVGAGPVGQFAALCLAHRGVEVEIVDQEVQPAAHSYALALHPASLAMLRDLGVDPAADTRLGRIDTIAFYDETSRRAEIRLGDLPGDFPYVAVLRQHDFESLLASELKRKKVSVRWNHRLIDWHSDADRLQLEIGKLDKISTGYPVALSEWEIVKKLRRNPKFVIGADGHRSRVRNTLEIDFESVGTPELFAVFEFACDWQPQNELRIVLTETTTSVLWPFPDGRCRWSFQLEDTSTRLQDPRYKSRYAYQVGRESFPHLSEQLLDEMLDQRAPWFDVNPGEVFWAAGVRFERRLAARFGRGRAWLAGDSGHLTGPAGIQSMNVGLREASDLAECIHGVLPDGTPGEPFAAYERERTREWRSLLGLENGVCATERAEDWVTKNGERILPCIPASGADLRRLLAQIGLELPDRSPAKA